MHAYTTPCYTTYPTLPEHVAAGGDLFNPSFERNHCDAPWTCIDVDTSTIDDSFSDIRPAFEVLQEIRRMMDARKERERKRAYDRLVGAHRNTPFSTTSALPLPPHLHPTTTTTTIHTAKSAAEMQHERQRAYDRLVGASPPLPATSTTAVHTVISAPETQCERQKAYDRLVGIDRAPAVDFARKSFMDLAQVWYLRFRGAPSV